MRSSKRKLYLSGSSKSETALTVLQLHQPDLLCYCDPHHLTQAHTVQQHRASSPEAALIPIPASSAFLVNNCAIAAERVNNNVISRLGRRKIVQVISADGGPLALSFAGAVVRTLHLTAVADTVVVVVVMVVTAVAVVTVTVLLFYAF